MTPNLSNLLLSCCKRVGMIQRLIFYGLIFILMASWNLIPEDSEIKKKLQDYFFELPLEASFDTVKEQLTNNPDFTLYSDPNRDAKNSIIGSISRNKHLNPNAIRNQIVIQFVPQSNKTKEKVSFKWSIDYKLEDLAVAIDDYERIRSDFKPFFKDISEKQEIGYHQEEIESWYLKKGSMLVTIRMLKFNNSSHTISLEYDDIRKKKQRK